MASLFTPIGIGGGGALYVPAISPHDPNLLFVASDMNAVYRSSNGGTTWTTIDKRDLWDASSCPVLFHPRDDQIVFAATRETLKVSHDRGVTWSSLCAKPPWQEKGCTALEIDGDDCDVMLAGTDDGAYLSRDGGRTWSLCAGIHGRVTGIALVSQAASTGRKWLIATSHGIFTSEGYTRKWQNSGAALPEQNIRGVTAGAISGSQDFVAYLTLERALFRSTDQGNTWQKISDFLADLGSSALQENRIPEYGRIQCAQCAGEIVYATIRRNDHTAIYRSNDSGSTWQALIDEVADGAAAKNIAFGWVGGQRPWRGWSGAYLGLAVSRRDPNYALFTNEAEIYRSADGGADWTQVYSKFSAASSESANAGSRSIGLEITAVWQFAFDPHESSRAYICHSDIGLTRSVDGALSWSHATLGIPWANSIYQIAFDPAVSGLLYSACADQHGIPHWPDIESAHGGGGVCVSRDWGASWRPIGRGLPDAPVTSVVLDANSPVNARILYAAQFGGDVYSSTDGGETWQPTQLARASRGNRHFHRLKLCADGTLYCAITGRREGTRFPVPGGLYRSRDGGKNWTELTGDLALRWPGDVETPADDSTTIYLGAASAPGYPQGGVYKSSDDGHSWRCVLSEKDLPQELCNYAHVLFVTVDPLKPATVYAGATKHGLFVSHDAGESWHEVRGIPFGACQRVAFDPVDPDALWVTTFGGGVWVGKK